MEVTDIKGTAKLRNGVLIPYFGLGVFQITNAEAIEAIKYALEIGYRHIDTASVYGNEKEVGEAIRISGISRKEIFVTTKVWNTDQGYDSTLRAFDKSLQLLGLDYIDLYLIHWPVHDKYVQTWKALERIYAEGKARAIGVSNFLKHHLEVLLQNCNEAPMVNQMEFHPYLVQQNLIDYCAKHGIQYEAWSPLMQGKIMNVRELSALAKKYNKDIAQLVLRWDLQKGVVTIPKSSRKERIFSNAQIFDFEISQDDMQIIDNLDRNQRIGPDPDDFDF